MSLLGGLSWEKGVLRVCLLSLMPNGRSLRAYPALLLSMVLGPWATQCLGLSSGAITSSLILWTEDSSLKYLLLIANTVFNSF